MITTTTPSIEGRPIQTYLGIVSSEVILGANALRDIAASIRDFFGGRSGSYEKVLIKAKEEALAELEQRAAARGANAIVGVDIDYEVIGANGSMLMVACSGTAVIV